MSDQKELWCIHIYGPDDVIAAPNEHEARAKARELNAFLGGFQPTNDENMPKIRAEAEVWPYGAEAHAKDVVKWAPPRSS